MWKIFTAVLVMTSSFVIAQDNYEIQVYDSKTQEPNTTMVELHSNYTFSGQKYYYDGICPTQHILHETIETTHGFTPWLETALYLFNAVGNDNRTTFVGSHLRVRMSDPFDIHLPVGIALSVEAGYQKREYCADDWTLEIIPIIDKKVNKWYFAFNPVIDRSFHGINEPKGFEFAPCAKASYDVVKKIAFGVEYYTSLGGFSQFDTYQNQQHQLFFVTDLGLWEDWEVNIGYGLSFTPATDNDIFKIILGYEFGGKRKLLGKN